ncbi:MAG TPA: DLW-39 family protein [Verrucomicrobiae bacterium]|nr:DLW-39 family protein [Verrucomicrobiae bacterium]
MKKLLLLALVAAVVYGTWKWLQQVQQNAASNQGRLKSPSEKALKEEK